MEVYEVVIYVCLEGVYVVVIVILSVSEQRERVIYAVFKGVVDLFRFLPRNADFRDPKFRPVACIVLCRR